MENITVKTENGGVYYVSVPAYMKCQREYDLNQNHIDTGLFWDFFSEHFKNLLEGHKAYGIDKANSPGLPELLAEQSKWKKEKEQKRRADRAWRDMLNKKKRRIHFWVG